MKRPGRKPLISENETREIIEKYVLSNGTSKKIKYIDLYNFSIQLYNNKEILILPSESYWRKKDRTGRKLIDEVNLALSHKLESINKDYELQNLLQIIDSNVSNKKIKVAIFNEFEIKQKKIELLEKDCKIKEDKIKTLKKSHEKIQETNHQQQEIIFQIYYYFLSKSTKENLDFFNSALSNIFSNPTEYLSLLNNRSIQKNNISDIFKNRLKKD